MEIKKLALFDFDGVLVDTLGIAYGINVEAQPDLSLETYKSFFEGNIHDAIKDGKKRHIPDFDEKALAQTREIKIPEALRQMVAEISKYSVLTIVSSSTTRLITGIIEKEGLMPYFSDILGSDVHTSKVEKVKTLLAKYSVSPDDAVFITDTLGDIREAEKCGVKSIAVTWGFHEESTLAKGNPVQIVHTPEELLHAIERAFMVK